VTDEVFDVRAALRSAYDNAPVDDDPRIGNQENGRTVIVELPAPWPHRNPDDTSVKLPLRVVHDGWSGLVLEIGKYDFGAIDIHMLKQAIAHYEQHGGETFPMEMVVKGSPSAAIYPDDDAERVTNVVDFHTGLPLTPLAARLRKKPTEE
jgi:hypothetical protein